MPHQTQAPTIPQNKAPRPPQAAAPQAVGRPGASHMDLVASARKLAVPISINGACGCVCVCVCVCGVQTVAWCWGNDVTSAA